MDSITPPDEAAPFTCPKCNSSEAFVVTATANFEIDCEGAGDHDQLVWTDASPISCRACKHSGVVLDFRPQTKITTSKEGFAVALQLLRELDALETCPYCIPERPGTHSASCQLAAFFDRLDTSLTDDAAVVESPKLPQHNPRESADDTSQVGVLGASFGTLTSLFGDPTIEAHICEWRLRFNETLPDGQLRSTVVILWEYIDDRAGAAGFVRKWRISGHSPLAAVLAISAVTEHEKGD